MSKIAINNSKRRKDKKYVVTVNVGKKGLTESLINEINLQLEKRGVVKVRMLRSFRGDADRRELARMIEKRVRGELVDLRGFVLTLKKG